MTVHPAPVAESEVQPSLGDRLRQLREEQNLSLDDVSRATRVSLANLRAIEVQAYDRLPADPFAKGMVVLYATHLGLDGFQAGARFLAERHRGGGIRSASQQNLARFSLLPKKLAEPSHVSSAAVAMGLLMVIVLSFTLFCLSTSWNPFAFLTERIWVTPPAAGDSFHPADPSTGTGGPRRTLHLSARFLSDVEVVVSADGSESQRRRYSRNTSATWWAERQLRVEFSQPDSAELSLNGSPLPFPRGRDGLHVLQLPADPTAP